jgi:YegS/Rv2252/BmrU family lipid kinase
MYQKWFVIINPTSGNGKSKKLWPVIYNELIKNEFDFEFSFTEFKNHSTILVQDYLLKGFTNFISIGGDGTLHNIVNGIFQLNPNNLNEIKLGVIPIGTGNDWVKTYQISTDIKKAIQTIKKQYTIQQDIGKIELANMEYPYFFNNLAGIGFDGFVVNKVNKFKYLGFLAYLTGALVSLTKFKKNNLKINFNSVELKGKSLMFLFGICKYSGGGMRLTKDVKVKDGLFDISYVQYINLLTVILNIFNLFNGKITNHKVVETFKTNEIQVEILSNHKAFIQADGELIPTGDFKVSILPKAIQFIIPEIKS